MTRVLLVDDHPALRKGVELLLTRHGLEVCGVAGTAGEARVLIESAAPDVALIDLRLPDESGATLTRELLEADPERRVLLYTGSEDLSELNEALECGARGFALKTGAPEELVRAIRSLATGGTYMDHRLSKLFLEQAAGNGSSGVSPREGEILSLLADGLTGAQIAKRLWLSPETVRTHVRNAMRKLEARTRVHAVALAIREREPALEESGASAGAGPDAPRP